MTDDFDALAARFDFASPLLGAFAQMEQRWQTGSLGEDATSTDMVAAAWAQLSHDEQAAEMGTLFNAFYHSTMAVRRQLELEEKEPDGNTYLRHGDVDILQDTLSGAAALSAAQSLDDLFPHGMVPVPAEVLQRLLEELALLQHRVKTRSPGTPPGGEDYRELFERRPENFTGDDARRINEFFGNATGTDTAP